MATKQKVDLVVGVDFGMTFTGVAYSTTRTSTPRVIQKWPGRTHEINNKVPSALVYQGRSPNDVKEWGFRCLRSERKKEWFKQWLDPERIERFRERALDNNPPTLEEVRKYYRDYLACLYKHVSTEIRKYIGRWDGKRVQFIFSLPSTLTKPAIVQELRELVIEAGFGEGGHRHTVEFSLTEPEAAAVYTIKDTSVDMRIGEIMLVCDAGGGTTDLAILESVGDEEGRPELRELTVAEGRAIGSTDIDSAFEDLVDERLELITPPLDDRIPWTMMQGAEFLGWKCAFGQSGEMPRTIAIKVPMVDSSYDSREAGIQRGKMLFTQRDFREVFDPQVAKMINFISEHIRSFKTRYENKQIDYIILSGGLGSSPYVHSRLEAAFAAIEVECLAPNLEILVSEDPQLAVVKGLVIDRIQKLKSGTAVLKGRMCRNSYGIKDYVPYHEDQHIGQPVFTDLDGTLCVDDQIFWAIKKGEVIDPDKPLVQTQTRRFLAEDSGLWTTHIVMSENNPDSLPTNTNHADATHVCKLKADLNKLSLDLFEAKRSPGKMKIPIFKGQPYYEAEYDIKVIIGATDLKFELWFRNKQYGEKYLEVEWERARVPDR